MKTIKMQILVVFLCLRLANELMFLVFTSIGGGAIAYLEHRNLNRP